MNFLHLTFVVFCIADIYIIRLIINRSSKILKILNTGKKTTAVIVDSKEFIDHDNQKSYYPIIKYSDENGQELYHELGYGKPINNFEIGKSIKVVYNESKDVIVTENFLTKWYSILILLFILIAITALICGIYLNNFEFSPGESGPDYT